MQSTSLIELFTNLVGNQPIVQALVGGIVIALLNLSGALLIMVWRRPSRKLLDASLGFAAGVMLTASFTSLIIPGIDRGGLLPVIVGILLGVIVLDLSDRIIPHLHLERATGRREGPSTDRIKAVWLFILAITIHNLPEGLAVGVGFGSGNLANALSLMLAIGMQNIPEGLAVSISARNAGMGSRYYASLVGLRSGLVEIPMAVIGAWAVLVAQPLLPYAMGFAAGAMLYVISDEIVPETHRSGHERLATLGMMLGVVVMLYLDVSLA